MWIYKERGRDRLCELLATFQGGISANLPKTFRNYKFTTMSNKRCASGPAKCGTANNQKCCPGDKWRS